ncbi:MAG: LPXTG cell wall anchor domain-containing protein [Treponema sp.]|nr:LPXTG cell wall anchor domain-containing protein [Treponema sp.]
MIARKRKKGTRRGFRPSVLSPGFLAAFLALAFPSKSFSEQEIKFRLYPGAYIPLANGNFTPGPDVSAALDWRFFPFFGASIGGELINAPVRGAGSSVMLLDASAGPVFAYRPVDRFSLKLDVTGGLYSASWNENSISGISFGGRLSAAWHLVPSVALMAFGAWKQYAYNPSPFLNNVTVGVGVSLNLSEMIAGKTRIRAEKSDQKMVFPVSYAWYNENPFASVRVTNNEPTDITMVNVFFYLEQYMNQPKLCGSVRLLKKGASVDIPVTAFFNDSVLQLIENITANAKIIVEYRSLSSAKRVEIPMDIPVYHRNAMSWDDDRRAASFVSARDPSVQWFSRYVSSLVQGRLRPGINRNIQYALGLFETLAVYGINYVIDPSSSYVELSAAGSLDSLNYPFQTLMYRGGDCDDLSILFCSLLEAAGIETAFITIPGHIYMAFDSGLTEEEARRDFYAPNELVYHEGKAWVPLEITIPREGFFRAWRIGAKEWRDSAARGAAKLYPMSQSWKIYPPVSVPGAASRFVLPGEDAASLAFDSSMNAWIEYEIRPQVRSLENRLALGEDPEVRNSLGILYGRYGMTARAREQFVAAARRDYLHGWVNLGNVAFLERRFPESLGYFGRALEQAPDNSIAILGMARSCYELNDFASSDSWYAELRRRDPGLAREYGYLASFFETRGRAYSLADRLNTALWSFPGRDPAPVNAEPGADVQGLYVSIVVPASPAESDGESPGEAFTPLVDLPVIIVPSPVLEEDSAPDPVPEVPALAALVPPAVSGRRDDEPEEPPEAAGSGPPPPAPVVSTPVVPAVSAPPAPAVSVAPPLAAPSAEAPPDVGEAEVLGTPPPSVPAVSTPAAPAVSTPVAPAVSGAPPLAAPSSEMPPDAGEAEVPGTPPLAAPAVSTPAAPVVSVAPPFAAPSAEAPPDVGEPEVSGTPPPSVPVVSTPAAPTVSDESGAAPSAEMLPDAGEAEVPGTPPLAAPAVSTPTIPAVSTPAVPVAPVVPMPVAPVVSGAPPLAAPSAEAPPDVGEAEVPGTPPLAAPAVSTPVAPVVSAPAVPVAPVVSMPVVPVVPMPVVPMPAAPVVSGAPPLAAPSAEMPPDVGEAEVPGTPPLAAPVVSAPTAPAVSTPAAPPVSDESGAGPDVAGKTGKRSLPGIIAGAGAALAALLFVLFRRKKNNNR